jgi:hypothetical protein
MSLLGAGLGAASGVLIRTWANGLGKQRLLARPWNHLLFGLAGSYIGYNYSTWESELLKAVNEKRVERGMPEITRQSWGGTGIK